MLVLTAEDIKKVFSMNDAVQASKDALRMYTLGNVEIPLRVNIDVPKFNGQSLFMPGYAEEINSVGIKIVSVFPQNAKKGIPSVPAKMLLLDGETGDVVSIMDGTFLTQFRTGAVAGAGTDILSRKDSKTFALFGTGGQASSQLEAVLSVRKIETVKVFDINSEKAKEFVNDMQQKFSDYGVKILVADSSEDAIKDADIITTVTTAKSPVFDGRLVKKGTHINGIGSYTPEMQEIDEFILKNSQGIFLDTKEGVLSEAGDLITPMKKGIIDESDITGELGEVILERVSGRQSPQDITIFKSVGSAILDLVTAYRIYEKALELGVGTKIEI
ncbi:ornithine cyclodeaminase Ocd [Gottschalkia purinilytica]|uniref:Ornithine cyclodeaminase Ocd n=1 Tax=Gottschalkia purinilytica TaxID=1503 RepID=A0A0L0W9U7_GOTPU|nr:ornithine cyclodeaminase family protein [Gottschalkia purinilytica]KNF08333.1 ornithine cyclodeaminase Ocd [Gottschalkia purinilytica]